jgi:hypothetical protein
MQHHAANQLHIEMALPECSLGGFAHRCKGWHEQIIERAPRRELRTELHSACFQSVIAQHRNFRLKRVEIGDIKGSSSLYAEPTEIEVGDDGKFGWPSKATCQQVLYAMQEAWSSKRPWSNHYHAKRDGRYAATIMSSRWGIEPELAEQMLETWLVNDVIEVSIADHKAKTRGLKVLRSLYDESAPPINSNWYED